MYLSTVHAAQVEASKLEKDGSNKRIATCTKEQTCSTQVLMDTAKRISHCNSRAPRTELECPFDRVLRRASLIP